MWPLKKKSGKAELAEATLENLAMLVRTARTESEFRRRLLFLVGLPSFQRKSAINTAVAEMTMKGEPREIIAAFALLADDDCAAELGRSLPD